MWILQQQVIIRVFKYNLYFRREKVCNSSLRVLGGGEWYKI